MNKIEIIKNYSKEQFSNFLEQDTNGQILKLLDEKGIEILSKYKYKEERIRYILTYSKYKNELFLNSKFVSMFLKCDITNFYATLQNLNFNASNYILENAIRLNEDKIYISTMFNYLNSNHQLKLLNKNYLPKEVAIELLHSSQSEVVNKIFEQYNIDLARENINYELLFRNAKDSNLKAQKERNVNKKEIEKINIPQKLITNSLARKIFKEKNIFKVRKIINDAEYSIDTEKLNKYIKNKEEELINYNHKILPPYDLIFDLITKINNLKNSNLNEQTYDELIRTKMNYYNILRKNDYDDLADLLKDKTEEEIHQHLYNLSQRQLSNYIIDYHFEENYHNVMLDLNELLNLYYNGDISLDEDKLYLYQQIQNIDLLTTEEKKDLHNNLKQFNIIEMFYDDMSFSRKIVKKAIKNYSITKEELKKYRSDELSEEYGIDVYKLGEEPFFAIVKTGNHPKDTLPTGHSYSLVGNGGIAVYGSSNTSNTFVYDANTLNEDQIVHIYPFDSFTLYKPLEGINEVTSRVNVLMMPEELVEYQKSYTELVILENGLDKTDFDNEIPTLNKIALYCIDKITKEEVETAKKNDVGIVLVNSKMCKKTDNQKRGLYRHNFDSYDYNYFNDYNDLNKFESKRK